MGMNPSLKFFPLAREQEREGPAAVRRWEGEGLLPSSIHAMKKKKKEDPHPTLSRKRERANGLLGRDHHAVRIHAGLVVLEFDVETQ
jgi:hypothetical protein